MTTPEDAEARLSALLMAHADVPPWELRHPVVMLRAVRLLRLLPVHTFRSSGSQDGDYIARVLGRRHLGFSTPAHQAASAIDLGAEDDGPPLNRSARKHARRAVRAGVTWRYVSDEAERKRFVRLAHDTAVEALGESVDAESVDFEFLLDSDLWLSAWLDDEPLVLSVTAIDGEVAVMRYFCRYGTSRESGASRYLMTQVLLDEVRRRGVRFVVGNISPFRLPPGPREFSRMTGFRLHRFRAE